jgi:hypothetical protein
MGHRRSFFGFSSVPDVAVAGCLGVSFVSIQKSKVFLADQISIAINTISLQLLRLL